MPPRIRAERLPDETLVLPGIRGAVQRWGVTSATFDLLMKLLLLTSTLALFSFELNPR